MTTTKPRITRERTVFHVVGIAYDERDVVTYSAVLNDDDQPTRFRTLEIPRDVAEGMGSPFRITVTVEPGDLLNKAASCAACGSSWTAPVASCPGCTDDGVAPEFPDAMEVIHQDDDAAWANQATIFGHLFLPVLGHPDDDECTHREDGTDATYCGQPAAEHDNGWADA